MVHSERTPIFHGVVSPFLDPPCPSSPTFVPLQDMGKFEAAVEAIISCSVEAPPLPPPLLPSLSLPQQALFQARREPTESIDFYAMFNEIVQKGCAADLKLIVSHYVSHGVDAGKLASVLPSPLSIPPFHPLPHQVAHSRRSSSPFLPLRRMTTSG